MVAFLAKDLVRVLNIDLDKTLSPGITLIEGRSRGWNGGLLCVCSIQSRSLRFLENKVILWIYHDLTRSTHAVHILHTRHRQ